MKLLTALCCVLAILCCCPADAASFRLGLGNGRSVKIKGAKRALARHAFSATDGEGFSVQSFGRAFPTK